MKKTNSTYYCYRTVLSNIAVPYLFAGAGAGAKIRDKGGAGNK